MVGKGCKPSSALPSLESCYTRRLGCTKENKIGTAPHKSKMLACTLQFGTKKRFQKLLKKYKKGLQSSPQSFPPEIPDIQPQNIPNPCLHLLHSCLVAAAGIDLVDLVDLLRSTETRIRSCTHLCMTLRDSNTLGRRGARCEGTDRNSRPAITPRW
jgi:hypothetical protein